MTGSRFRRGTRTLGCRPPDQQPDEPVAGVVLFRRGHAVVANILVAHRAGQPRVALVRRRALASPDQGHRLSMNWKGDIPVARCRIEATRMSPFRPSALKNPGDLP
jgi:hypothetical protein